MSTHRTSLRTSFLTRTLFTFMITVMTNTETHYRQPGWFTTHVLNNTIRLGTRLGIGIWGARTLEVAGRKSGQPRRTPVNLLVVDGHSYLVAARGETEWVRNVRAARGRLALLIGRRRQEYVATEIDGEAQVAVLRAYLKRWKMEVGMFFDGAGPDSTDEELAAIAPRHPAFELAAA